MAEKLASEALADKVTNALRAMPFKDILTGKSATFRSATQHVMETFRKLGTDERYVCETWLYDVVWFDDDEEGLLTRLPMVLECEWSRLPKHEDKVDPDFSKTRSGASGREGVDFDFA